MSSPSEERSKHHLAALDRWRKSRMDRSDAATLLLRQINDRYEDVTERSLLAAPKPSSSSGEGVINWEKPMHKGRHTLPSLHYKQLSDARVKTLIREHRCRVAQSRQYFINMHKKSFRRIPVEQRRGKSDPCPVYPLSCQNPTYGWQQCRAWNFQEPRPSLSRHVQQFHDTSATTVRRNATAPQSPGEAYDARSRGTTRAVPQSTKDWRRRRCGWRHLPQSAARGVHSRP